MQGLLSFVPAPLSRALSVDSCGVTFSTSAFLLRRMKKDTKFPRQSGEKAERMRKLFFPRARPRRGNLSIHSGFMKKKLRSPKQYSFFVGKNRVRRVPFG